MPLTNEELRQKLIEVTAKLHYALIKNGLPEKSAEAIAKSLFDLGFDNILSGGFWVWEIGTDNEWYSDKFREALGYTNAEDFPNVPASWQGAIFEEYLPEAVEQFEAHFESEENPYFLEVEYRRKDGGVVALYCSGSIVNRTEDRIFMIGTHDILEIIPPKRGFVQKIFNYLSRKKNKDGK